MCIFFQIIFHYRLLQDAKYSPLFYKVNPSCLSILCIVVCICKSRISKFIPLSIPFPSGNHKFIFYVCEFVSVSFNNF